MHGFSPNYRDMLTKRGSRADQAFFFFFGGGGGIWQPLLPWQHLTTIFWGLPFVGLPLPKPMRGFLQNFQDMKTEQDLELIGF